MQGAFSMLRTISNAVIAIAIAAPLAGCGLAQKVSDTTSSTASAIFYKQVKTLSLDFNGRGALNTDAGDMTALSVPTVVRVYQVRDKRSFELATYEGLLNDDDDLLKADLLDKQSVLLKPGEGAQLNVALKPDAQFVTVVALLRTPDAKANAWRLILERDELDADRPRVIDLGDDRLHLRPRTEE
jgi:type VI secretion system protein VasD